jgi:hypothetical protein
MGIQGGRLPKLRAMALIGCVTVLLAGCGNDATDESAQAPTTTGRGGAASAASGSTSTTAAPTTRPCPPSTSKAARATKTSAAGLTEAARQHFTRFQGCSWASRIREIEVTVDQDEIANINRRELLLVTDAGPDFAGDDPSAEDRAVLTEMCKAGVTWGRVNLGNDPRLDIVHDREYHILSMMERLTARDCRL